MLELFLGLSFLTQILIVYLLLINIVTFFFFALDKFKASGQYRRTPEKVLWLLSLIGGSIGALGAMYFFRHKTKKDSFQAVMLLIICLQITLIAFLYSQN